MITKTCLCLCATMCALPYFASASSISVATPNFFGAGLSPTFGTLVTFDSLTPFASVNSDAFTSDGVESVVNNGPDQLIALPFSQQSPPNELSTTSADYAGDITFTFSNPTNEVGIGIAEDGTTPATLTVFDASGNSLGSFVETVSDTTFNGYYVISDGTDDIKSFSIDAAQNLAVDDLQFVPTPEPASVSFAVAGLVLLAGIWRRKVRQ